MKTNFNMGTAEMITIGSTIFVVALTMIFIIIIVKSILSQRLKREIIKQGIPATLAESVLKSEAKTPDSSLKWSLILAGLGIGLALVHYTSPFGLHSIAILCISVAIALFIHFFLTKNKVDKN